MNGSIPTAAAKRLFHRNTFCKINSGQASAGSIIPMEIEIWSAPASRLVLTQKLSYDQLPAIFRIYCPFLVLPGNRSPLLRVPFTALHFPFLFGFALQLHHYYVEVAGTYFFQNGRLM